jgi:hypothetical protein
MLIDFLSIIKLEIFMIVEQIGYKKIEDVIKMKQFSIYETTKKYLYFN